jgi:glycine/D-amino acid oxidase-like deaminating enzyme
MIPMKHRVAIVGAGVSGLSCGVVFAQRGHRTTIFAREIGPQTTSAVAAALWFPYDVEPVDKAIPWALETYQTLIDLARNVESGVSMIASTQRGGHKIFGAVSRCAYRSWIQPFTSITWRTGF